MAQPSTRKDGFGTAGIGEDGDEKIGTAGSSQGGTGNTKTGGTQGGGPGGGGNPANKQGDTGVSQHD